MAQVYAGVLSRYADEPVTKHDDPRGAPISVSGFDPVGSASETFISFDAQGALGPNVLFSAIIHQTIQLSDGATPLLNVALDEDERAVRTQRTFESEAVPDFIDNTVKIPYIDLSNAATATLTNPTLLNAFSVAGPKELLLTGSGDADVKRISTGAVSTYQTGVTASGFHPDLAVKLASVGSGQGQITYNYTPTSVPEPRSISLVLMSFGYLLAWRTKPARFLVRLRSKLP